MAGTCGILLLAEAKMKLRYKFNLIAVGYCLCGSLVTALCGNLWMTAVLFFLAWFNWVTVLNSETKGDE